MAMVRSFRAPRAGAGESRLYRSFRGVVAVLLGVTLVAAGAPLAAVAAPVYQITTRWVSPVPAQLTPGQVVTAEWRVSVNDDAPAPSNDPVDNVTAVLTATDGYFSAIPDACLTTGVSPASALSVSNTVLTCNLGTHNMGTAVVVQTPIIADGSTGDAVTASGVIGGASASLPLIPIVTPFKMDINWTNPSATQTNAGASTDLQFEWTLNLFKGSPAGPNSVSYTIDIVPNPGAASTPLGCVPFSTPGAGSGHPWSGGSHPATQMANSVGCTLTATATPNRYTLTLSGINYAPANIPTLDSAGRPLPTDRNAIASGAVVFRVPTPGSGSVTLQSSAPTYTAAGLPGVTVQDDASNNSATKAFTTPGGWSSAFLPQSVGSSVGAWTGQIQTFGGAQITIQQHWLMHSGQPPATVMQACSVYDPRWMAFNSTVTRAVGTGQVVNFGTLWYYTGSLAAVNPASPSYNPEALAMNCDQDPGGWSTTPPANLSTVKATKLVFTAAETAAYPSASGGFAHYSLVTLSSPSVPAGTDIWKFDSVKIGAAGWSYDPVNLISPTPGLRYSGVNAFRDVVRIASVSPFLEKSADRSSARPGDTATFTLSYAANGGPGAPATVDGYVITDTLPVGLTYVPGSATPAPSVATNGSGQQVLTWTLNGVTTNQTHALTYQTLVGSNVTPGQTLQNAASAAVGGQSFGPARSSLTVPTSGFTSIGKSADIAYIPNVNGDGVGAGSWTVTLRSSDPLAQAFTDTIDILPYNGDGRGTSFTGDYDLTGVVAGAGATVYYTAASPATLSDDPGVASNGSAGSVVGNTVGWSTTMPANPTAVRVIGPALAPGATQQFTLQIETDGVEGGDLLVNRAQARTGHTELVMRTSAPISVANYYSASLKKYVQDADGVWHDANDVADYPTFRAGDTARYRIVVENTGQGTLTGIVIDDDRFPEGDFTIDELPSGEQEVFEFDATLTAGGSFVNTACGSADIPDDSQLPPTINCDPAGVEIVNYTTVKSSDPATGSTVHPGDLITYTVTVTQSGTVPAAASFSDDLADVLDDATLNGPPTASLGTASITDGVLDWSGTVPVDGVATITYAVTVKDSVPLSEEGDYRLGNVVTSEGCVDAEDCATEHPVADFRVVKTADPASGSSVQVGDQVEYTVTVTQLGTAPYENASLTDDLSDVLDDATWAGITQQPGSGTATFATPTLSWSGDLADGEVVTFQYAVDVTAAGDGRLDNVVTSDGCWVDTDCATTHLTGRYSVVKSSNPVEGSTVEPGATVTYTVTVTQIGEGHVENAAFTDDLSGVVDDASWVGDLLASSGQASLSGDTLNWVGDLAVGQTVTVVYSVLVGDDGDLTLENVVSSDGCATEDDCATEHPIGTYRTVKTSNPASGSDITPGDTIEYTVTVTQDGPGAVADASFIDDLSLVLDEATWVGDLTASAGTVSFASNTVTWNGPLAVGEVVTVTYSVVFVGGDDNRIRNVVSSDGCELLADCVTTHPGGTYIVEKASDPDEGSFVAVGETIEYTITVTQIGPAPVDASLEDDLSAVLDDATWNGDLVASDGVADFAGGALTWSATLQPGDVVTITYSVTVTGAGDTELQNVVTSDGCISEDSCETSHVTGDYTVVKSSVPGDGDVQVGETIDYTITVTQSGAGTVPASLSDDLSDVLDDATWNGDLAFTGGTALFGGTGINWTGTLAPGAVVQITYSVTVTALGDGELDNVVTSDGCESAEGCDTSHDTGRYEVVKTSDPASGSTVKAGETIEYTITVSHFGVADVPASLSDDLTAVLDDATWNGDLVASAGSASFVAPTLTWSGTLSAGDEVTITYSVDVTADGDSLLTNVVTSDGCVSDEDCTTSHQAGRYTVSKTSNPVPGSTVQVGDSIVYTVEIRQEGVAPLTGVTVTDDLADVLDDATWNEVGASAGSASLTATTLTWSGDLAVDQVVTITYRVTVTAAGDMTLVNQVTPDDAGECIAAPDQNPDCTTSHLTGRFEYSKMANPAHNSDVSVGDEITYTVTIEQVGPGAITSATLVDDLTDVLDDATWNDEVSATSGTPTFASPLLTWTGPLSVGAVVTLTYTVTVTGDGNTTLANVVTSDHPAGSCVTASDGTEDCRTIHKTGGYVFSKTSDPGTATEVVEGSKVTYTLTITHRGEGAVTNAQVTDTLTGVLDDAIWNDDESASDGSVARAGDVLTWTGDLAVGQVVTITYSVTVNGAGDAALINVVESSDGRSLCDPTAICATAHRIVPAPPLAFTGAELPLGMLVVALLGIMTGGVLIAARQRSRRFE